MSTGWAPPFPTGTSTHDNREEVINLDADAHALPGDKTGAVRLPARAWIVVVLALAAAYLVTMENGIVLEAGATHLHELFHDGRHFFGVPCH